MPSSRPAPSPRRLPSDDAIRLLYAKLDSAYSRLVFPPPLKRTPLHEVHPV